ncbi:PEP-CTERM sorting domain-containing protein [Nostoc sp. UHCC 0926]|uniref:PEP-CTERM sorting domain-containing protein n=1 Tax=unclassified Nostoc TaxID=2593658 RepID=UPI0023613C50|nr:PEP-CTERM sorting domain-containing protein [Nostoc sp. UHCC 0926]WDD32778.1 PEP-CTERM sorting domain-containing protein [Nostoc sp. UHCC 0926]
MKTYHVLQATLTLATCALSALAISTSANASTVVTFDDLKGDNLLVPDGYGGIQWDNNWIYYGFEQNPYTPESIPNRIYGNYIKWDIGLTSIPFYFASPVIFDGGYFAGMDSSYPASFSLYNGGTLQATSASLTPSSTPTFLSSGYTGLVDEVRVNWYNSETALDNVTYHTAAVPEPASLIGLVGLGAFGVISKLKRNRKPQVNC